MAVPGRAVPRAVRAGARPRRVGRGQRDARRRPATVAQYQAWGWDDADDALARVRVPSSRRPTTSSGRSTGPCSPPRRTPRRAADRRDGRRVTAADAYLARRRVDARQRRRRRGASCSTAPGRPACALVDGATSRPTRSRWPRAPSGHRRCCGGRASTSASARPAQPPGVAVTLRLRPASTSTSTASSPAPSLRRDGIEITADEPPRARRRRATPCCSPSS